MKKTLLSVGALLLLLGASPCAATVLVSLTRTTFQDASASLSVQTFDSIAAGTTLGTVNGVTYSSSAGTPVVTNQFLTSTNPNGLGRTTQNFFSATDTAIFAFNSAITAFAIDINTFASAAGSYDVVLNNGDQAFSIFANFTGTSTGQFIGFVSDTPFTIATVSANNGFAYTLDTLLYGSKEAITSAVPEPPTWLMMLAGFAMVGGAMRRTRTRVVATLAQ